METKKFIIGTISCAIAALLAACSTDELATGAVQEGQPVSLKMEIAVPEQDAAVMTRATDLVETNIEKLALLFYKDKQDGEDISTTFKPVVIVLGPNELGNPNQVTSTNYKYTVNLTSDQLDALTVSKGSYGTGLRSGEWHLYAVANYDKSFVSVTLDDLKSKSRTEIDEYLTGGSTEQDIVETAVLMSGKYGTDGSLTLNPGVNELSGNPFLKMRRTISKNIFTFTVPAGSGIKFTPTSYKLYNYSSTSTLFERDGRADKNGGYRIEKTENGTTSSVSDGSDKALNGESNDIALSDTTFYFYTQENLQTPTNNPDTWAYTSREAHTSASDQSFAYAPASGTYVVVKGTYEGPRSTDTSVENYDEKVKGDVTYTIHLGDFSSENGSSYNNFSVLRNVKYNYKVTIKGVNSIITECTANDQTYTENNPGAEGNLISQASGTDLTLDAHYEQVLLQFDWNGMQGGGNRNQYKVTLKTPYTSKTGVSVNSNGQGGGPGSSNNNTLSSTDDYKWVQFMKPERSGTAGSYTYSIPAYPGTGKSSLGNIRELLNDLNNTHNNGGPGSSNNSDGGTYFCKDGNTVYVVAFVNEYYYTNSDENDLGYRSDCTGLSNFVNADNRELTLASATSTSKDGKSSYTTNNLFSIKQRSIKCPFELTLDNPFGIETVEETEAASSGPSGLTLTGTDELQGWKNYANSGAFSIDETSKWATYINQSANGWIKNSSGVYELSSDGIMNSGYSYAIYQCLSRNRDLNGDGYIGSDELRWYLPAEEQCLFLWLGDNSLPTEARLKTDFTSDGSVVKERHYLTSTISGSVHGADWWINEGSAFGDLSDSHTYSVRAARSLVDMDGTVSSIIEYDEDKKIVNVKGLNSSCIRTGSMTGQYSVHQRGDTQDKLPSSFKIASKSLEIGSFNDNFTNLISGTVSSVNTYSEDNDAGYWRIPNEKELSLVYMLAKDSLNGGEGSLTKYIDAKVDVRAYFVKKDKNNITTAGTTSNFAGNYTDPLDIIYIRPVRDVTSSSSSARHRRR